MGILNQTEQQYYNESSNFGNYQFTSLDDIINQFMVAYVGEEKIIGKASRTDVQFHAMRALAELSFDTFKSIKSQEIELPPSLVMTLPQDYVNYTKISCVDNSGIKHPLYPTLGKTSNPVPIFQNEEGDYKLTAIGTLSGTIAAPSKTIVLNDEYLNILVGMIVSGPSIPDDTTVVATSNSGGITTIEISNDTTYTGTETLTFTNEDGSLILEEESSFVLENLAWTNGENKITQSPNTDVSNIKVGMLVSHEDFNAGTTVVDVNGAVITTSTNANADSSTLDEATFVSTPGNSTTWNNYKSARPSENKQHDYDYDDHIFEANVGRRYGIDPQHAQDNGSYYIDDLRGLIYFSSNISGKTVVLDYISDSLGTDNEMQVHKFAEEAMYKSIMYAILSTRANTPEYIVRRYKKERFAEIRKAKLRLSNIKLEEITQIFRGKSKHIKH